MNGKKVADLMYVLTGCESWEQSQYFWYDGKKVCQMYNTETGEIKLIDANGNNVLDF